MKLTKENEKIMRKAKRYIRTFPLSTEEIRQIEEDITGMALESQERGEDFMEVIGKPIREFCEDLVFHRRNAGTWRQKIIANQRNLFSALWTSPNLNGTGGCIWWSFCDGNYLL